MNNLDIDHAKALDKSTAGDTLSGAIVMASTASIIADNASNIIANVAGAIVPTIAGAISDGGIAGGIQATIAGGINTTVPGGISDGGIAGGIAASRSGGIASGVSGGIKLTGNTADWIGYSATRTVNRIQQLIPLWGTTTGWTEQTSFPQALVGPATSQFIPIPLTQVMGGQVNGAALTTVTLCMIVAQSHSNVPATMPTLNILRASYAPAGSVGDVSLFSGGAQSIAAPGSGAAWYASGNVQQFTFTPNQDNVIDTSQYTYVLNLVDENGSGALSGNNYFWVLLTFTGIANSCPS
jgi:hypothetical protein